MEMEETGWIATKDLKAHPDNARTHEPEQIQKIANSIDKLGWGRPIIISEDNYILAGHGAYLAATEILNLMSVPFKRMQHLHDSPEAITYMMADNKLTDDSDWNYGKLELNFEELELKGFDLELTGFDEKDLLNIKDRIQGDKEVIEDDFNPDEVTESIVQPGQIWKLGNHRLMCGDSTKKEDFEQLMNGQLGDMVFTDPPYGVKYEQGKFTGIKAKKVFKTIKNDDKQADELFSFISDVFKNVYNSLNDGAPVYCCSPSLTPSLMILYGLIESNLHIQSQLIWVKNQFILGRADYHWQHEIIWYGYKNSPHYWCNDRTQSTIWEIKKDSHSSYKHPTQKPIELAAKAIQNSSLKNDIILDLFGGSGSTLIACEQLQRQCYMMELDPHYCDVIIQRWENFTGEQAIKEA